MGSVTHSLQRTGVCILQVKQLPSTVNQRVSTAH
jgi:hypothetical protein